MFKTRITEMFGIEHPIIQGGMMGVGTAPLVSAVAKAGALGFMTALTQPDAEALEREIGRIKDATDRPFGVNLTFLPSLKAPNYPEYIDCIIRCGVKIVETAGRSPEPYMAQMKAAGIKVIHKCTAVRHALKAEKIGCDAVSIDGFECAGHPGENDTPGLILIPAAADKLTIPFVASGGFGDGRGLAAALALGADGINMGTRFMLTEEAPVHDNVKRAMAEGNELSTTLIFRALRNTERVFKNEAAVEVNRIEKEKGDAIDIADLRHLVSGQGSRRAFETGDVQAGVWSAGLIMALIDDIPSCKTLVDRIVRDAEAIVKERLPGLLS